MPRFTVRTLGSEDFGALQQLELDVFGAAGDDMLCPHYLRLCTEFFDNTCFLALADSRPAATCCASCAAVMRTARRSAFAASFSARA